MALITYEDKNANAPKGSAPREWTAADANEVKDVVNANAASVGVSPATQAEVDAGIEAGKYVAPKTLAEKVEVLDAAGTDTYTATIPGVVTTGRKFIVRFVLANTGVATLNTIPIKKNVSVSLVAGDIAAGEIKLLAFDGTNLQIIGAAGSGSGDVAGPAGAPDGDFSLYDGLTGKIIKASGMTPSNDDFVQRKSGVWTNRSINQVRDDLLVDDVDNLGYMGLGSGIKAQTIDFRLQQSNTSFILVDESFRITAVYLPRATTLTGAKFWQLITGNYTANNNNRIGLYTYSAGVITLVASSANDGTLWQTAAGQSMLSVPFSSAYPASAGLYFIGIVYSNSAQVTAPQLVSGTTVSNAARVSADFPDSGKLYATLGGQTNIPSSQALSAMTAAVAPLWVALY